MNVQLSLSYYIITRLLASTSQHVPLLAICLFKPSITIGNSMMLSTIQLCTELFTELVSLHSLILMCSYIYILSYV